MKKLVFGVLLAIFFIIPLTPAALGADIELITDTADLLTDDEYRELNSKAKEIAVLYDCEVAIITIDEIGDEDAEEYAIYFYDEYNFGIGDQRSGLLLFLSMEERDYALIAHGFGNTAFTDHGKDVLLDKHVRPLLAKDDYYGAFSAYLETADEYLAMARDGAPFDTDTDYGRTGTPVKLAIVILLPLLITGIICLLWRSKMKTAVAAQDADNYIPADGFHLTGQEDRFLYRTETRRKIESRSSVSSGGTKVGRGGYSKRSGKF